VCHGLDELHSPTVRVRIVVIKMMPGVALRRASESGSFVCRRVIKRVRSGVFNINYCALPWALRWMQCVRVFEVYAGSSVPHLAVVHGLNRFGYALGRNGCGAAWGLGGRNVFSWVGFLACAGLVVRAVQRVIRVVLSDEPEA
jgi:hypothetical protein